jgi:DNA-binding MarR family transcriptional regulator
MEPVRSPHIEHAIGYWLISATRYFAAALSDLLASHCAERGKPYVVTPPQWGIMAQLALRDRQSIGELARHLGVDGPSVTNLVKRLEQNGLVHRARPPADERTVEVSLTDEARDLFASLGPLVEDFQDRLLPDGQRERLVTSLQCLVARLSEIAPAAADRDRFDTLRGLVAQFTAAEHHSRTRRRHSS